MPMARYALIVFLLIALSACASDPYTTGVQAESLRATAQAFDAQAGVVQAAADAQVQATSQARAVEQERLVRQQEYAQLTAQAQMVLDQQSTATIQAQYSDLSARATAQEIDAQAAGIQATKASYRATAVAMDAQATADWNASGIASQATKEAITWSATATVQAAQDSRDRKAAGDVFARVMIFLVVLAAGSLVGWIVMVIVSEKRKAIGARSPRVLVVNGGVMAWDGMNWRLAFAPALPEVSGEVEDTPPLRNSRPQLTEMEIFINHAAIPFGWGGNIIPRHDKMGCSPKAWMRLTDQLEGDDLIEKKDRDETTVLDGTLRDLLIDWRNLHQPTSPTQGNVPEE